jgi:hypothetical protein
VVSPSHLPFPIRDFLDISYPFTGKVTHLSHYLFGADRVPLLISPFLTIAGWIDNYGNLITIRSGTERIVIIGRHKVSPSRRVVSFDILLQAAVDIMEKQGGSVADRPRMIAAGEILRGGQSLVFAPVGERFRLMRRYVAVCDAAQIHLILVLNLMQSSSYSSPA